MKKQSAIYIGEPRDGLEKGAPVRILDLGPSTAAIAFISKTEGILEDVVDLDCLWGIREIAPEKEVNEKLVRTIMEEVSAYSTGPARDHIFIRDLEAILRRIIIYGGEVKRDEMFSMPKGVDPVRPIPPSKGSHPFAGRDRLSDL